MTKSWPTYVNMKNLIQKSNAKKQSFAQLQKVAIVKNQLNAIKGGGDGIIIEEQIDG